MTTQRESKRILSVTVKRIADYDADTSDLGEFSDTPEQYAIVHVGEYAGQFADSLPCECGHTEAEHDEDSACTVCRGNDDGCDYFDRASVHGDSRLLKYFNPNAQNYEGCTEEEIEKYCLQDYERMRQLDQGDWGHIGIRAEAVVQLSGDLTQTISSGGLWGIETDSEDSYIKEVEDEELDQLKAELHAIGFTKRAIAAAMRSVEREDN